MRELALAAFLFGLLALVSFAIQGANWEMLLYGGVFLVGGGLLFSVPCAVRYHLNLYRALKPRGALDRRWIWNPTGQHGKLTPAERSRVMPWFYAGAAGWGASVLGCALIAVGAWLGR